MQTLQCVLICVILLLCFYKLHIEDKATNSVRQLSYAQTGQSGCPEEIRRQNRFLSIWNTRGFFLMVLNQLLDFFFLEKTTMSK